jgi:hypothetical protein
LGVKAPKLIVALGAVMSYAERFGACIWGCQGGDHAVEHLVGSCVATTNAGLRLAESGYYDEAISLSRQAGERANLLGLLSRDPAVLAAWRSLERMSGARGIRPSGCGWRSKLRA